MAQALRSNGIDVTAMHQHHLSEQPKIYYMHFWANDEPAKLAQGLRAALDQTNSASAQVPVRASRTWQALNPAGFQPPTSWT